MIENCKFGIIQGRLTKPPKKQLQYFPTNNWKKEFVNASKIGFKFIEMFSERKKNKLNPIWSEKGVKQILKLSKKNNISLDYFCDDYIINNSFKNIKDYKKLEKHFLKLFKNLKKINCKKLILPFLEKSNLSEINFNNIDFIKDLSFELKKYNIILCIESLIKGKQLRKIIEKFKVSNIRCVFDTGNRVFLDKNFYEDILILNELINHIHLKDKNIKNENVIFGTGDVNFLKVFEYLEKIKYNHNFVFETNRGIDPLKTARFNLNSSKFYIKQVLDSA